MRMHTTLPDAVHTIQCIVCYTMHSMHILVASSFVVLFIDYFLFSLQIARASSGVVESRTEFVETGPFLIYLLLQQISMDK